MSFAMSHFNFRIVFWVSVRCILLPAVLAQNPVAPAGVYFADPSAHVWNGKLYLYGSLDESCDYYCSTVHHILVSEDLKKWNVLEDRFSSSGITDQVFYNNTLLYAPDCNYRNDTFYLYYCQPDPEYAEGVAVSLFPEGPFTNGQVLNLPCCQEIDPSLFIDKDGQAYYLWGQFSLKMAKMKPNMRELDLSTFSDNIITEQEHFFHEGAFLTRRNNTYYLVYADISRAEMPTCIGYATSDNPFGPYTYRGVIIDNDHCNPGNWNNHGSIVEFNGKWYVFYHRSTNGCEKMRKACMEPIEFLADGTIPEVEMTSQGAGDPLDARSRIQAEMACVLHGNAMIQTFDDKSEGLTSTGSWDKSAFKYINFGTGVDQVRIKASGFNGNGKIILSADDPWHNVLGEIPVTASSGNTDWKEYTSKVREIKGIHELWIVFQGADQEKNQISVDWFEFY